MPNFDPDLYEGDAAIEVAGESFAVVVAVASVQRHQTVRSFTSVSRVAVGPRSWFGKVEVPDATIHAAFGTAVTHAAIKSEDTELVLPDGRRGVVDIDDSLWFEGRGPWPAEPDESA